MKRAYNWLSWDSNAGDSSKKQCKKKHHVISFTWANASCRKRQVCVVNYGVEVVTDRAFVTLVPFRVKLAVFTHAVQLLRGVYATIRKVNAPIVETSTACKIEKIVFHSGMNLNKDSAQVLVMDRVWIELEIYTCIYTSLFRPPNFTMNSGCKRQMTAERM